MPHRPDRLECCFVKLFYTPNSPYSRIARIAVREAGLVDEVDEILALNRQDDNPVLAHSPVGRVPTLVDGQIIITEARDVVSYIASVSNCRTMQTADPLDWISIAQNGQILGFLDGIATWVRELRRGSLVSQDLIVVEAKRCERSLHYLNTAASNVALPAIPSFGAMALASAIDLMDTHGFAPDWRARFPPLSTWFEEQRARASMQATRPQR